MFATPRAEKRKKEGAKALPTLPKGGAVLARFNNAGRSSARHRARGPPRGKHKLKARRTPRGAARAKAQAAVSPSARPRGGHGTQNRRATDAHPHGAPRTRCRGRARRYPLRADTPPPRLHRGRSGRTRKAAAPPRTGNPCTAPATATTASPVSAEEGDSR